MRLARISHCTAALTLFTLPFTASDAQQLTPAEVASIDSAVPAGTGAPSSSIAVVRGGQIVYERAYGDARIDPKAAAMSAMRYAMGSVSKQFTAAAILLLAEDGRLSLDDSVAKWFPERARRRDQRAAAARRRL